MVKLTVRDRESIQEAVRRFRKLVERSGIKKEMRRREYYEKPSEVRRRAATGRTPHTPYKTDWRLGRWVPIWRLGNAVAVGAPVESGQFFSRQCQRFHVALTLAVG